MEPSNAAGLAKLQVQLNTLKAELPGYRSPVRRRWRTLRWCAERRHHDNFLCFFASVTACTTRAGGWLHTAPDLGHHWSQELGRDRDLHQGRESATFS